MLKRSLYLLRSYSARFIVSFSSFLAFFLFYSRKKILTFSSFFELNKNYLVRLFMTKRGRYNRTFLHVATMSVLGLGVILTPYLASTYPVFSSKNSENKNEAMAQSIAVGEDVFQTNISAKPRDKIINYTVTRGDTISTIAEKFGISENTIKWENDLTSDDITVGDTLKILPVTGMSYKVQKGDSVYTIAKQFDTEAQKIVDFPFNDFANPETFSLVEGQILIVPDAIKPSQQPYIRRQVFIAQGPVSVSGVGFTWPLRGLISQFASWYHMALDITSPVGTPIVAAQDGTVTETNIGSWNYGYGTDATIDGGNGLGSHYAHMSGLNVSVGEHVAAGKTIVGWVGITGRTTGPHLHFEVKRDGALINPLNVLQ